MRIVRKQKYVVVDTQNKNREEKKKIPHNTVSYVANDKKTGNRCLTDFNEIENSSAYRRSSATS